MNMRYAQVLLGLLLLVVTVPARAGDPTRSHKGPVDYTGFVDALRAAGATVVPVDTPSPHLGKDLHVPVGKDPLAKDYQGPFGPEDQLYVITVNGQRVSVHEFPTREVTERAAKGISPDGDVTTAYSVDGEMLYQTHAEYRIDMPPHWYESSRLIVLYVGRDGQLLDLLITVLGPQFAGRFPPGS